MPLLDAFSSVQEKRGMILTNWEFRKQLAVAWVKRTKQSMQANAVSWQRGNLSHQSGRLPTLSACLSRP